MRALPISFHGPQGRFSFGLVEQEKIIIGILTMLGSNCEMLVFHQMEEVMVLQSARFF